MVTKLASAGLLPVIPASAAWPLLANPSVDQLRALRTGELTDVIVPAIALDGPGAHGADGPLVQADRWVRDIIGRVPPGTGQRSPICPFISVARRDGHLHYVPVAGRLQPCQVQAVSESLLRCFMKLWPHPGQDFPLKSLVVIFVDRRPSDVHGLVVTQQERLTSLAAKSGLMAHEFSPHCPAVSTRKAPPCEGSPPVSTIVIRWMTPKDRCFLDGRPEWLAAYEGRFGWPKASKLSTI
jgi:hypothetical protein